MKPLDLITIIQIILGVVWGIGIFFLYKRNKSRPSTWPWIFGIGTATYWFVASMTGSILLWPASEFVGYTLTNFLWSLAAGLVGYFSGHKIMQMQNKE